MATTLIERVIHWRKKLDKNVEEDTILSVIQKLSRIPITSEILEVTHIGKTVRKLSKRGDLVGEKARGLLKKWRNVFAEQTLKGSSKSSRVSKQENTNKCVSSGNDASYDKTIQQEERSNREYKHERHSSFHTSPQQSTLTGASKNSPVNTAHFTSPSNYTYEKEKTQLKFTDYDPHTDVNEEYNPECPELFPGEKSHKTKKQDLDETEPSLKHKSEGEEQSESLSKSKKVKTENLSNSHLDCCDKSKKSQEKQKKFHKSKDPQLPSNDTKSETSISLESVNSEKIKMSSGSEKSKSKDCDGNNKAKSIKSKTKLKINCSEEFTSSVVKFEDCLGFNDIVTLKKKKSSKSQLASKKDTTSKDYNKIERKPTSSSSSGHAIENKSKDPSPSSKTKMHTNAPKPNVPASGEVDISSTLPETQPNYQPLPHRSLDFCSPKKREVLTNEDAIRFISSRKEKTVVYSGRKTFLAQVPSLLECCTGVLIEHIDAIEYLGDIPYSLLKPVLERCTPAQLLNIENYNPNLLDSTNELWEIHCKRDYKLLSRDENETWRDLYLRAHDEREKKLKSLTANISASIAKSNPVRQVKLAFVDSIAKPPREVARRQAKNGTARPVKQPVVKAGSSSKVTPKKAAPVSISVPSRSENASVPPKKFKVAPLMAKTLKSMKQYFRR